LSTNKSRFWWILAAAWGLLLLGLGVWSAQNSPPTVREQSDLASGKKTIESVVDQATATITGAVPAAKLADGGYQENVCEITPMRDGKTAVRALTVTGANGNEAEVLRALRERWPGASLQPGVGLPDGLFYDAGNFVLVRGKVTEPGTVVLEMLTGCRPLD
jgi:hypothetical protein